MEFKNILFEKRDRIANLIINRPKALNALNRDTLLEIRTAVENARDDDGIDVLIISGAGGKAFVAGADITFMLDINAIEGREFGLLGQSVLRLIESMEKPVIAAIDGFCLGGGCELAMACDFRICTDKSKFGQPEVGLGVTPGFGGTQRLPRLVGTGMAKQLLYTGEIVDADEALRCGLVNYMVPAEELMDYVMQIARKISSNAQVAVRFCKVAVNEGMQTDIDRALTIEADLFGLCFASQDQKEGMDAFVSKRKANFIGK